MRRIRDDLCPVDMSFGAEDGWVSITRSLFVSCQNLYHHSSLPGPLGCPLHYARLCFAPPAGQTAAVLPCRTERTPSGNCTRRSMTFRCWPPAPVYCSLLVLPVAVEGDGPLDVARTMDPVEQHAGGPRRGREGKVTHGRSSVRRGPVH